MYNDYYNTNESNYYSNPYFRSYYNNNYNSMSYDRGPYENYPISRDASNHDYIREEIDDIGDFDDELDDFDEYDDIDDDLDREYDDSAYYKRDYPRRSSLRSSNGTAYNNIQGSPNQQAYNPNSSYGPNNGSAYGSGYNSAYEYNNNQSNGGAYGQTNYGSAAPYDSYPSSSSGNLIQTAFPFLQNFFKSSNGR